MSANFDEETRRLRRGVVEMAARGGEGHIPSALSIVDILFVLYRNFLPGPGTNSRTGTDPTLILSKGHGSLALYQSLAMAGFLTEEHVKSFASFDSILGGHPDRTKVPGVVASTGSLGHGLPLAVGVALARRAKDQPGRVFVLVGDGEANEGSVWEAALVAAHHGLSNLTCIVDNNASTDRSLRIEPLADKFSAFNWAVVEIDGHDEQSLVEAFSLQHGERPLAIIANTVKGKGVPEMEGNPAWHHKAPSRDDLDRLVRDLL